MAKKTIADTDVSGKSVLMRVDFNVPMKAGTIRDDRRIRMALHSIRSVIDRGGRLILMSHLGRPSGEGFEEPYSLKPVADQLEALLNQPVVYVPECLGEEVRSKVASLNNGQVLLLENLRFHHEEKSADPSFAQQIATLGDIYCNDAFGTCHRGDASMVAVPTAMGARPKVVGFLVEKELRYLQQTIDQPERPFVAILGGAKVSDKLGAISALINKVDTILIGGAMTYTFMLAQGKSVGDSLIEPGRRVDACQIMDHAAGGRAQLLIPTDHVCGRSLETSTPTQIGEDIPSGWVGLDIGPKTIDQFASQIDSAKNIVWNGPMGAFETPPFDHGTRQVAQAIADATDRGATSIIGGGDSAAAIEQFGLADCVSHVSTGGGASLQMLEGKQFQSVALLDDK